jgi:hypothetical protein
VIILKQLFMKKYMVYLIAPAILVLSGCSGEISDWKNAKAKKDITALEQFIKDYPNSSFKDSATLIIEELSFLSPTVKHWGEVTSIEKIQQGDYFKLEPIRDTAIILAGDNISITPVTFKCSTSNTSTDKEYKTAFSMAHQLAPGISAFETQLANNSEIWPKGVTEQTIKIPITIIPTGQAYKGKSQAYLYLVDAGGNCISNIIEWQILFK